MPEQTDPPSGEETQDLSRRRFLAGSAAIGVAATVGGCQTAKQESPDAQRQFRPQLADPPPAGVPTVSVSLKINGKEFKTSVDCRTTLLDFLRENVGLTGTKKGCDHGQCGACTVHVNGRRVNSCLTLLASIDGEEVTTIEGIGTPENLHPMQAAFLRCDGYQCGYCTSGQIMSAVALLKEPCGRGDAEVKELMSGNICRCGAYANILAAIQEVRHETI